MEIEFDIAKDQVNIAKHGVSLARTADFDALSIEEDERREYGETRFRAYGLLDGRPHCLAFTMRGSIMRPVSLRRAHKKEYLKHVDIE
jgi:hypothetical protein